LLVEKPTFCAFVIVECDIASDLLVREKKGMKWKKAGKMSLFDIESIVYVVFLPSRAHRRDCQMYASGSFNGFVASLTAL
jgi:hypothetical protein